jgi:hypothetical protein
MPAGVSACKFGATAICDVVFDAFIHVLLCREGCGDGVVKPGDGGMVYDAR